MTITNFKIATKINIAFVALIAAFMISAGVTYGAIQAMGAASLESSANMRLSGDANFLLTEVLEQTNALRGFVIKGDPKFAATYKESKASFDRTLSAMAQTARSPEQQTHLKAMRAAMAKWRLAVGDKVVGLMATPGGQAEAAALSGVKSLTLLRQVQGQIRATAQAAAAKSEADHARATRTGSMALILGSLLSLVIAALMGLLLSMTVGRPVAQMTALMRRLAEGETQIDIPASVRTDEIGDMAKAILSFKDAAIRKAQLEAEAAAARRAAEAERDRSEAAARAAAEELAEIVGSLAAALSQLAAGDLSYRLSEQFPTQYEVLKDDFNKAVAALNDMVAVISGNAEMITEGVGEIATASQDLSRRTEHQAATLERTAAALDQVTATVKRSAEGAIQVSTTAASAKIEAQRSGVVMRDALAAMSEIEHSSGQIVQIIGVIDEIAFQTNLLALNAGVEAARAGDGGRGFAVVAQEVRALAQRSADAAREIKSLIASSSDQVQRGVRLVGDTGVALDGIAAKVTEMDALIAEIAQSSQEQARGLNQVNTAVNQMDQVTQQNAAMVEETTAAVANLRGEAVELARLVAAFETGDGRAPGAGRMLARSGRRAEAANPVRPPQGMLAAMAGGA